MDSLIAVSYTHLDVYKRQEKYITSQERDEYEQKHSEELKVVNENLYPSDMRGWIHIDEWSDESMCREIEKLATEIRENAEVFVVVGLGGSNQGARAVIEALSPQDAVSGGPEILYAALNLSASYYESILQRIGNRSVYINAVSYTHLDVYKRQQNWHTKEVQLLLLFQIE